MIRNRFCVSCYNRDREVAKGRNAKGGRPSLALRDVELAVERDGAIRPVRHRQVASAAEAMLAEARRATGPLAFVGSTPPPARDDGWRPVPHVCRSCLGRVLERAGLFRCPNCDNRRYTTPVALCGCGLRPTGLPARHRRLFLCRARALRDPDASAAVVVTFADEPEGADAQP